MPDISMCQGGDCPMKEKCYRFTATPTPGRQAYISVPYKTDDDGNVTCDFYDPTEDDNGTV